MRFLEHEVPDPPDDCPRSRYCRREVQIMHHVASSFILYAASMELPESRIEASDTVNSDAILKLAELVGSVQRAVELGIAREAPCAGCPVPEVLNMMKDSGD